MNGEPPTGDVGADGRHLVVVGQGGRGRRCERDRRAAADVPFLARVVAALGPVRGLSERTAPYLDLLDRVVEDKVVTQSRGGCWSVRAPATFRGP